MVGNEVLDVRIRARRAGLVIGVLAALAALIALAPGSAAAKPVEHRASTTVPGAPFAFTDSVTIVDATDATFSGEVDPNGLDTTYYFEYAPANNVLCPGGTDNTPPTQTATQQVLGSNSGASVSASIGGLTSGAGYCVQLVASNTDGSDNGGVISFVSGAPTASTDSYTITGAATASISYTGNAGGESGATLYVGYDTDASTWCQNLINGTPSGSPTNATTPTAFGFGDDQSHSGSLPIGGLTAGTNYCAQVFITNSSESNVTDGSFIEFTAGAPTVNTGQPVSTSATGVSVTADINPDGQTGVTYVAEWDKTGTTFCNDPQNNTPAGTGGTTSPATMPSSAEATETVNFTVASAGSDYCVLVVATAGTVKDTSDINYADFASEFTAGVPLATTDTTSGTGTGPTSGQISGTVNPAGQATTYDAEYWIETAPNTCPNPTSVTPTGTTTATPLGFTDATAHAVTVTISGLQTNAKYCAEVIAQNTTGNSTQAVHNNAFEEAVFSTGAPAVTTDGATSLQATAATIDGSVNPQGDGTTTFWVAYDVASSSFCTTQNTSDATILTTAHQSLGFSDTTPHSVSANLTALTTGTAYCAEVVAHNASGTTFGEPAAPFTPAALPIVNANSATATGATTETLAGSVNPNSQSTNYQFAYALANSAWCLSTPPHSGAGVQFSPAVPTSAGSGSSPVSESANLTSLTPGAQYCWELDATNTSGPASSDGGTFNAGLPGATNGSASAITNTTATLSGTVNPEGNSTEFNFDYAPSSSTWCTSGGVSGSPSATAETPVGFTDTAGHSVSANIGTGGSPLSPGTTYCFEVLASNAAGDAHGTPPATFTTTGTGPNTSHTLTVTISGTGSGTVSGGGIACPGTCSAQIAGGSVVTLTATAASGSTLASWSGGGCSGTAPTCNVTMNGDQAVTVTFTKAVVVPPPPKPSCTLSAPSGKIVVKKPAKGKPKTPLNTLVLSAHCTQSVSGTLTGVITETVKKGTKKTVKSIKLGPFHFSLAVGKITLLNLKLPASAITGLKKKFKESASLTLTWSNANGSGRTTRTIGSLKGT
jgi:hypothetical protein